ncbi:hypothetical protein MTO96_009913 [Rhipicephalus appendiculatus]
MKALQYIFRPRRSAKAAKIFCGFTFVGVLFLLALLSYPGCTNSDIEAFLDNICDAYRKGEISGNLCTQFCAREISKIQCQTQHIGKDVVFTALWNLKPIVVKAKKRLITALEPVYWKDRSRNSHYPDNDTFIRMVNMQINYVFRRNFTWVESFYEIHQCDMKSSHFGVDAKGLVKMLDLDAFALHSTVQENIANTGPCEADKDCDFFDCAGRCNAQGQCDPAVLNNNLQRICKNIFLGNLFGRYTGLLRSPPSQIAAELHALLNECGATSRAPLPRNRSRVIKEKFVKLLHSVLIH